jgi:Transcriptional regulator PadR-like family
LNQPHCKQEGKRAEENTCREKAQGFIMNHPQDSYALCAQSDADAELLRLQLQGWIASDRGASENNRKAKYYSITKSGRKQLGRETENWERIAGVIGRLLRPGGR